MKLGIISDIHGNEIALDAVLEQLQEQKVERIICLGDLIGGAPMTEEVVQKIMNLNEKLIIVRGNREKYLIEGMPEVVHDDKKSVSQEQKDRFEFFKNQLSSTSKEFIYSLPKKTTYTVEDKKIYIAHYPMDENGNFRKHIKKANIEENLEMFSGIDADIYLYGHTHQEVFNIKNNKYYINPGPLGFPGKTNLAPYAVLTINSENIEYEQLYAKYDVNEVIERITNLKFVGYKGVLKHNYGVDI